MKTGHIKIQDANSSKNVLDQGITGPSRNNITILSLKNLNNQEVEIAIRFPQRYP